jgi:hypothetical protein
VNATGQGSNVERSVSVWCAKMVNPTTMTALSTLVWKLKWTREASWQWWVFILWDFTLKVFIFLVSWEI